MKLFDEYFFELNNCRRVSFFGEIVEKYKDFFDENSKIFISEDAINYGIDYSMANNLNSNCRCIYIPISKSYAIENSDICLDNRYSPLNHIQLKNGIIISKSLANILNTNGEKINSFREKTPGKIFRATGLEDTIGLSCSTL